MVGRRVMPMADGTLPNFEPGDYGRCTWLQRKEGAPESKVIEGKPFTYWQIRVPNGDHGSLDPRVHTVVEHPDGTITVSPSIVTPNWHGFLQAGVWRIA